MRTIADPQPELLYLDVANHLKQLVISGKHEPGDRLPRQRDFAKRLGVSLETFRKALAVVVRDGYVVTKAGRGTFVGTSEERTRSALVVDDDGNVREYLQRALTNRGWRCVHTRAGYAALTEMQKNRFDVIFLDLVMAGMSGVDTFRKIRRIDQKAHVVIMTADPGSPQAAEALGIGMLSHKSGTGSYQLIPKPFDLATLEAALARSSAAEASTTH